jgi:hypothetical protein
MMHSTVIVQHRVRRAFHADSDSEIGHSALPPLRIPPAMSRRLFQQALSKAVRCEAAA